MINLFDDAPIPATTVTGPDAFGAAAAVGTSQNYAREDHDHGLPASPSVPSAGNTVVGPDAFGAGSTAGVSAAYSRADHDHGLPAAPAASLTSVVGTLTAGNVACNVANSFFTGTSISITAGTWLIIGYLFFSDGGVGFWTGRLFNTTDSAALAEGGEQAGQDASICIAAIVTVTGAKTIAIQAASTDATGSILRAVTNNSSGNLATRVIGVKIA